jgi:SAM-dependent methyltransferase
MGVTRKLRDSLPARTRDRFHKRLNRIVRPAWLGTLRRTGPLSNCSGYDRGTPIDRYYIDVFLERYRQDIHGHVLEIKDSGYTLRYGTDVHRADVLDIDPANAAATIVADLGAADAIPADTFDCLIITQTLCLVRDLRKAVGHLHRILRRGGVLLVVVPSITKIGDTGSADRDYWRLTVDSCSLLFGERFGADNVIVHSYGNFLAAVACLAGMASEELSQKELNIQDDPFPVIVAVRAIKH